MENHSIDRVVPIFAQESSNIAYHHGAEHYEDRDSKRNEHLK